MTDISITYPDLMGYDLSADNCPMIVTNLSGAKVFAFLKANEQHIPRASFGAGFQQLYIQQGRVKGFIAYAAKHGLKAERTGRAAR